MTKKIIVLLCVLGFLALLVIALMPSPVPVSASRVEQGYFAEFAEDEGFTCLRFTHIVTAPVSGYLRRVDLEPGDRVASGDILFFIEPSLAQALDSRTMGQARESLEAARSRMKAAQSDLERLGHEANFALTELERQKRLFERGVIAQAALDRYQNDLDRSLAAKGAARALVEAARYEMENARAVVEAVAGQRAENGRALAVKSPISGMVLRRERHHEGVVAAGEVILETGSFSDLEVRVNLLSSQAVRVRPGMRVILEHWGGDGQLEGRVRRVEPAGFTRVSALGVDEQRVGVFVELTSPPDERRHLGDGFRVEARFILWEEDGVIQIPSNALFRKDDKWQVFVVENNRAVMQAVETGRRSGLMVQITKGLEPGQVVVTHPGDRLHDGARVKILGE
ncbi:MAG: efflux RND transporter periplasmic adaptor subunit [Desulfatibacillaceae bacterium]|nr:efflux RND transporter periplasmic adaptor subunit [Desulfatibacillaceae bacterium]